MSESKLHKRVSHLAGASGSPVGQSFGEPIRPADIAAPDTAIRKGPASRRRPDRKVWTREGIFIAVEVKLSCPVAMDKREAYLKAGIPALELDIDELGFEPSDSEVREWLQLEDQRSWASKYKNWVVMPSTADIVKCNGRLRCLIEGCSDPIRHASEGVYISPQMGQFGNNDSPTYDEVVENQFSVFTRFTLPRLSCREHMMHASVHTTPGGYDWHKRAAEPNSRRVVGSYSTTELGNNVEVSARISTTIDGPKG